MWMCGKKLLRLFAWLLIKWKLIRFLFLEKIADKKTQGVKKWGKKLCFFFPHLKGLKKNNVVN